MRTERGTNRHTLDSHQYYYTDEIKNKEDIKNENRKGLQSPILGFSLALYRKALKYNKLFRRGREYG